MSGSRWGWSVLALALSLGVVLLVWAVATPVSPGAWSGVVDASALRGRDDSVSGTVVSVRSAMRAPWSVIMTVDTGAGRVDVLANATSHFLVSAPIDVESLPGSAAMLPQAKDAVSRATGMRLSATVRMLRFGVLHLRWIPVVITGKLDGGSPQSNKRIISVTLPPRDA